MINEVYLSPDSVMILQIGVSHMPPHKASAYTKSVVSIMKERFSNNEIIAIAVPGQREIIITVIHQN